MYMCVNYTEFVNTFSVLKNKENNTKPKKMQDISNNTHTIR